MSGVVPLQFGLFPSPEAAHTERLLELVTLAEVEGLDLVSVQDHPYQPSYADTWTLLSYLGARTSTIRLAPNVASLPLRPPVVLAKSAATLDLLTGGRVELGLGAGAFWDAIAAAGGERRTPRAAVDALAEAVELIRLCWAGGTVRFEGEHYRAAGLKAGPLPAHDIPIWLGAYQPRMLALTGRLADAWVPSQGYADPPDLPALAARVDDAALAAGRSPAEVTRIYNVFGRFGTGSGFLQGSPRDWAEQLAELTLSVGMTTYILGSDDPAVVARWAAEVAPQVRDLVAADWSAPPPTRQKMIDPAETPPQGASTRQQMTDPAETSPGGVALPAPTPDDQRVGVPLPWEESTRPTYSSPVAATVSAHDAATAQHLVDVHDGLRAELAQVRGIVDQVRGGQVDVGSARSAINTMTLRQNNWTLGAYCEAYCRIVTTHHTLEDVSVFPHLRRSDAALGPVLDRLAEEHVVIHDVLDRLDRALVALVSDLGPSSLDALAAEVDLLTDTLLSHLAYEERELLPALARHGFG